MPTPRVGVPVPEKLARASVLDHASRARTLGDSWRDRACLVSFLRHFGCTGCSEHVTELLPCLAELRALGVGVVFVGNGEPRYIEGFVERLGLEDKQVDIVTDPSLAVFEAAGLTRSLWSLIGPRSIADQLREIAGGQPLLGLQGDALQQGGSMIVDRAGVVAFYHRSASLGGHARAGDIMDVALRLATARARATV